MVQVVRTAAVGKYEEIAGNIGALVDKKNAAYGNSIHEAGQIIRILYPRGIPPEQYDDFLALIRIVDKLFRIANQKKAFGESPFMDIAGYGILKCRDMAAQEEETRPAAQMEDWMCSVCGIGYVGWPPFAASCHQCGGRMVQKTTGRT